MRTLGSRASKTFRVLAAGLVLCSVGAIGRVSFEVMSDSKAATALLWSPIFIPWIWFFGTVAIRGHVPKRLQKSFEECNSRKDGGI